MPNYAEELSYWYLRLNGFFPLSNFVYHRLPKEDGTAIYNADADILALRPPYYHEEIGKERLNCDGWIEALDGRWIGIMAEVKGSENVTIDKVEAAFARERIEVSVLRLGLFQSEVVGEIIDQLVNQLSTPKEETPLIIKVLFTTSEDNRVINDPRWLTININSADDFIRERINSFLDPKFGGRYFFPSSLFQYLIWKERPNLL